MVLQQLGRIPEAGESVEVELPPAFSAEGDPMPERKARMTVERMSGLRIDRLRFELLQTAQDGDDDE